MCGAAKEVVGSLMQRWGEDIGPLGFSFIFFKFYFKLWQSIHSLQLTMLTIFSSVLFTGSFLLLSSQCPGVDHFVKLKF